MRKALRAIGCSVALAVLASRAAFAEPLAWRCEALLCVAIRQTHDDRIVLFDNRGPIDATVRIVAWPRGIVFRRPPLRELVLAPGQQREAARFYTETCDENIKSELGFEHLLGSQRTVHDDRTRYAFPFGGTQPRRLAAAGEGITHAGALRFAYDFDLPEGTPVLAARAGTVVQVKDGFHEGGTDPRLASRANAVVVAHADGTVATYGHLRAGVGVRVADCVTTGQRIGESGDTGFSTGPHLHFQVGRIAGSEEGATLPIRFVGGGAAGLALEAGRDYGPAREVRPASGSHRSGICR